TTGMHIWYSNGSSFSFASKWISSSYDATKIGNRIVSGDFDRDGFLDDVAAFYAYDAYNTTIHVWKSTGPNIIGTSTNGWFSSNSYS
ncbi:hypothetical protein, partial [Streptococcus pneumoniae]|uniref:hypothetical protein n=1 Tax=Streptococcus pneumoniae TaxID=1313 RepID=UPI001E470578